MADRNITESIKEETVTLLVGLGPDTDGGGASFKDRAHVQVSGIVSRSDGGGDVKGKSAYKFTEVTEGVPVNDPTELTKAGGLTDQERDDLWDLLLKVWTFHKSENGFA